MIAELNEPIPEKTMACGTPPKNQIRYLEHSWEQHGVVQPRDGPC
jgi:hypothetical protein